MLIHNVFGFGKSMSEDAAQPGLVARCIRAVGRQLAIGVCGIAGHDVMLHFEPDKLSLQCAHCGYQTQGWEVGRPMMARRQASNPQARLERRRSLRTLPTNARLAS